MCIDLFVEFLLKMLDPPEEKKNKYLKCRVCFNTKYPRVVNVPCGHCYNCLNCALVLDNCPVCTKHISRYCVLFLYD